MGLLSKWGLTGQFAKTREETETWRLPRARAVLPGADQWLITTSPHPFSSLMFPDTLSKISLWEVLTFHFLFVCYFGATLPVPSALKAARGIGAVQRKSSNATRAEGCWGMLRSREAPGWASPPPSEPVLGRAAAGQTALMEDVQEQPCMCLFNIRGSRGQRLLLRFYSASPV